MGAIEIGIFVKPAGVQEFTRSLKSISDALKDLGPVGEFSIDGSGLEYTFLGAPLVDVAVEPRREGSSLCVDVIFRPAGGLGILVSRALMFLKDEPVDVVWENGWPSLVRTRPALVTPERHSA